MVTAGDVRDLLEERPDLEPAVEAVLEAREPFAFDDLDLDSGAFGELVSRDVVEKGEQGYRVADPEAVRRGLSGEVTADPAAPAVSLPTLPVTRVELGLLLGALLLVVLARLVSLPNVYTGGHVVLSSNDPYYYRYLVEQLISNPDVTSGSLPYEINRGEPLLVVALWLAALVLGGTEATAGHVMAWYPVVSAAVTALLLYALAVVVTEDRRVGLAAVSMLAVVPGHAFRTSLGFADHHAFDYPWLVLTALAVVVVVREANRDNARISRATAASALVLSVALAGQTLAWDSSPLLFGALGAYVAVDALRAVHRGSSPLATGGPVVAGTVGAAALVWLAHSTLGWHTTLVASAPALLALGSIGVVAIGEVVHRFDLPPAALGALEAVGLVLGALLLRSVRPEYWIRLTTSLQDRLLADRAIAEVAGLFDQSGGWLTLLGFALFLGVPYLVWGTLRTLEDGRWLPPVTYAWYFLVLSAIQVRFVGELAAFLALFAGLGLVHLAERIDVARRPAPFTDGKPPDLALPEPRQVGSLVVLFLLVGSLGIVQVPVKTNQVTVPQSQSAAAFWMAEYSEERDMEHPANYVFSEWGWNRMYNYHVSGESRSYGFAQANFGDFVRSQDPEAWYERLNDRRGFVVTTPEAVGGPGDLGTRLHRENGNGFSHYRLVHVSGGGQYKVFAIDPGAVIEGTADPDATVTAIATVEVSGTSFTYARPAAVRPNGNYTVRVARPGEYRIAGSTVTVNESAVVDGSTIRVGGR